jgi:hypothetical protein
MLNQIVHITKTSIQKNKGFIVFASIFFISIFILENINHRFWLNDFKVYYLAAKSLLLGKQVYGLPFGLDTGLYKYSPFTLLTFTPFCLFSYYTASCIHYVILFFSTVASIIVIQKIISSYIFNTPTTNKNVLLSISIACIIRHIFRELQMGNVNVILVFLISLGLLLNLKSKNSLSGIFIGLAIMIKPYFILLMLPLLFNKKIKTVLSAGLTIIFCLIFPLLLLGITKGIDLHKSWLISMFNHNTYITSNDTLVSLINYYFNTSLPNSFQYYIIISVLIIYSISFFQLKKITANFPDKIGIMQLHLIVGYFVLFAIIPNLLLTDTEHFMFSLPLILILLNYLSIYKNYLSIIIFVIIIILYAGNSSDVFGNELSDKIDSMGLLGISNLFLIIFSSYAIFKNRRRTILSENKTYADC